MRKKVAAGNWKMNFTKTETVDFLNQVKTTCNSEEKQVIFFVPALNIIPAMEIVKGSNIEIGCQNMHQLNSGAYTGDVSADMLLDIGVKYVLIGHSERRQYSGETDEIVNLKTLQALNKGLKPVVCVGENLEERELNITNETVNIQVKHALLNVTAENINDVIIAYEPIWAIGTGKTATSEQANEVCAEIRKTISAMYDAKVAENITILYGGSVSKDNAKELFAMSDIDGGLVGGASLKPDFSEIVNA